MFKEDSSDRIFFVSNEIPGVNRHQRRLFGLSCTVSACALFDSPSEVTEEYHAVVTTIGVNFTITSIPCE